MTRWFPRQRRLPLPQSLLQQWWTNRKAAMATSQTSMALTTQLWSLLARFPWWRVIAFCLRCLLMHHWLERHLGQMADLPWNGTRSQLITPFLTPRIKVGRFMGTAGARTLSREILGVRQAETRYAVRKARRTFHVFYLIHYSPNLMKFSSKNIFVL